jgi:Holliday junction resolvasome RuvABC endonuclease subunit
MAIAGIDYSLTSPAVCIHDGEEWSIDNCTFHFFIRKKEVSSPQFVGYEYPEWNSDQQRYENLSAWTLDAMFNSGSMTAFIEGYAFGAVGRVFNIAENGGYLKQRMWLCGIEFEVFAPTTIKKFATGKGNASKIDMYESFITETGVDIFEKLDIIGSKNWNPVSDIIDAYYIAKHGFFEMRKMNDTNL